jgi:hypothetical protein
VTEAVLITGASAGLGAGMARIFAARGADLAITARRLDRLDELRAALAAEHPDRTVATYALDVTDHDAVFATFDTAAERLGHLDRIVVNAGLGKGSTLGAGRFGGNRDTALTNFVGGIAQCEAAMRVLYRQGRGQLVVISSVVAARGLPGPMNVYAASKAARHPPRRRHPRRCPGPGASHRGVDDPAGLHRLGDAGPDRTAPPAADGRRRRLRGDGRRHPAGGPGRLRAALALAGLRRRTAVPAPARCPSDALTRML